MVALHIGDHALEHSIGMAIGPKSQVLLTETLRLGENRDGFLQRNILLSECAQSKRD